jgi:hypothetical protein
VTRTAPQRRAVALAAIAAAALMGGGIDPTARPAPQAAPEAGALPSFGAQVAPAPSADPAKPAGAAEKSVAAGKAETLPWAKAGADKAAAKPSGTTTTTAALSPCLSMTETACREAKKECAWIADVKLDDGNVVPARCLGRMPAPPKKKTGTSSTSKKSETAKAVEKTPAATAPAEKAETKAPAAEAGPDAGPVKVQVSPPPAAPKQE